MSHCSRARRGSVLACRSGMAKRIHQKTLRERSISGGRQISVEFRTDGMPDVPATLLLPNAPAPVAGALLLHGYSSRKEHMSESVGGALLAHGVASLAVDLPLHGARRDPVGTARGSAMPQNPLEILKQWRLAVREARLAVHYLRARPEVDGARVGVVGYSLGSFLATLAAAEEKSVRAVVVAAGGDLPADLPFAVLARTVVDPLRAVKRLDGRPLLVVHGRHDRTMRPDQAQRLFDAAQEPKEIRWWDTGHYLPPPAIDHAAGWLAERLR